MQASQARELSNQQYSLDKILWKIKALANNGCQSCYLDKNEATQENLEALRGLGYRIKRHWFMRDIISHTIYW